MVIRIWVGNDRARFGCFVCYVSILRRSHLILLYHWVRVSTNKDFYEMILVQFLLLSLINS